MLNPFDARLYGALCMCLIPFDARWYGALCMCLIPLMPGGMEHCVGA